MITSLQGKGRGRGRCPGGSGGIGRNGKDRGVMRDGRKGGHETRGWDYVIKAITVHRTVIEDRLAALVCATRVTAAGCCTCVVVVIPALLRRVRSARSAEITHPKTPRAAAHAHAHDSRAPALLRAANEPRSSISCQLTGYESPARLAIN